MLITDFYEIGNRMLLYRKKAGMSQVEIAERAGISDRTYADIERGTVNMRMNTFLRICATLHVSPNDILTKDAPTAKLQQVELIEKLEVCSEKDRNTALRILHAFLKSIDDG